VLSRIGYLSELNELPEWMRVEELINFTRAFYPNWDEKYCQSLRQNFELEPRKVVQTLSKGQRARLGLLLALSYRPELLVLDEPSSGLDPLVRRDILRAIIRTIAQEGRTVLFSSHLLDEVERVADRVAIINGGRVIHTDDLETLKSSYHRVVFHFGTAPKTAPQIEGYFNWQGGDRHWSACYRGDVERAARLVNAEIVEQSPLSLNEIFLALVGSRSEAAKAEAA
jgi:ABC-2 type transport system ATP-binding protein